MVNSGHPKMWELKAEGSPTPLSTVSQWAQESQTQGPLGREGSLTEVRGYRTPRKGSIEPQLGGSSDWGEHCVGLGHPQEDSPYPEVFNTRSLTHMQRGWIHSRWIADPLGLAPALPA